jgi:Lrp/AsnC family transcriptional regulator, leucine-responsive regulatory protein
VELVSIVDLECRKMLKSSREFVLDEVDKVILRALQSDGRQQIADLARAINFTPAAALKRVRALEQHGYISRYSAVLDPAKLGFAITCFMQVSFQWHKAEQFDAFLDALREMPEVLEAHKITGEYDYLLKVIVRDTHELEAFHNTKLTRLPGVARTLSHIVLSGVKTGGAVPVS